MGCSVLFVLRVHVRHCIRDTCDGAMQNALSPPLSPSPPLQKRRIENELRRREGDFVFRTTNPNFSSLSL